MNEQKITRRSMLRGVVLLAQKCSDCVYFQKPNKCAVVEGDVSAEGWSILFNKKS